jgi:hypothetical protein
MAGSPAESLKAKVRPSAQATVVIRVFNEKDRWWVTALGDRSEHDCRELAVAHAFLDALRIHRPGVRTKLVAQDEPGRKLRAVPLPLDKLNFQR